MPRYVVAYLDLAEGPGGAGKASPSTRAFKSPNNSAEYARFYTAANIITCEMIDRVHGLRSGMTETLFDDDPDYVGTEAARVYFGIEAIFGPRDPSVPPTLVFSETGYLKMAELFSSESDPVLVPEMRRVYFGGKAETCIFDPAAAKKLFAHVPLAPIKQYENGALVETYETPLERRAQATAFKRVRALPVLASFDPQMASAEQWEAALVKLGSAWRENEGIAGSVGCFRSCG